jgi:hypothetical protein
MDAKMEAKVGHAAGKVWMLLGEKGPIAIPRIPKLLKDRSEVVYQALGWLAREHKVHYHAAGKSTTVSLNDFEAQVYRRLFAAKAQTPGAAEGAANVARKMGSSGTVTLGG